MEQQDQNLTAVINDIWIDLDIPQMGEPMGLDEFNRLITDETMDEQQDQDYNLVA